LGVYLFNWQYEERSGSEWTGSGFELIYGLTNPVTDFLGSALYFETIISDESLELEGKLLLQKNFGPLIVAYNLVLESEWEGDDLGSFNETNGKFKQTVAATYDLTKSFSVGAELVHEIPLPDWRESGDSSVFVGPNASVRFGWGFVTATALFAVTNVEGEPDAQIRVITGFDF
jgi:hypothetical protein